MGQQFLDLEGTKILANKIKEGERKVVFVGSENPDTNGWYKVASQTCNGYGNTNITFMVTSTYGNYHSGILQLQIRSDSDKIGCTGFKWLSRIGFDINNFIIVINGMTWTLYAYQPITRYGRICFEILSRSSIAAKDMAWTLNFKDNYTKESTTPNATVKSSDGATVNHANTTSKLQTARTINGVSFDESSNISINSMTSNSNITLHADSDSSSTAEYASIKAGGNELKITSSGGGSSPAKNNNNLTFNGHKVYNAGSKPTKADVGLGNVDNTSDLNKPISTAMQNALNGKSNNGHTHDDRYYTESEINSKINTINNNIGQLSNPNLLINGDFQVWQRGTTATIPTGGHSGYYCVDRWKFTCNLTKNITISKSDSGNLKIEIPEGTTESPGSNLNYLLSTIQIMETPPIKGQEYSFSIKFKQSVPNALRFPGGTSDVINDYVILKYNTVWNVGNYVWFDILKPATIEVEYVKLELGSVVTPFVPRHYAEELALCQRYYEVGSMFRGILTNSITRTTLGCEYKSTKRVKPTVTLYANNTANKIFNESTGRVSDYTIYQNNVDGFSCIDVPDSSSGIFGTPFLVERWTSDAEIY